MTLARIAVAVVVSTVTAAIAVPLAPAWAPTLLATSVCTGALAVCAPRIGVWFAVLALTVLGVAVGVPLGLPMSVPLGLSVGIGAAVATSSSSTWTAWLQSGLVSVVGVAVALFIGISAVDDVYTPQGAALLGALTALGAQSGLLALLWQPRRLRPTQRTVRRTLRPELRPPVLTALTLVARGLAMAPSYATRAGLDEVASWIYALQLSRDRLMTALSYTDPDAVRARLDAPRESTGDAFTDQRMRAASAHRQRLLEHHASLVRECERADVLVDSALAWLEEAVTGLALAEQRPGDGTPPDLDAMLTNLRDYGHSEEARRRTARELAIH